MQNQLAGLLQHPTVAHLRPYQSEDVEIVLHAHARGVKAGLGVAATGLGKTQTFLAVVELFLQLHPNARVMILAHRKELIEQPIERMRKFHTNLVDNIGVGIVMDSQNDCAAQIVMASVPTISRLPRSVKPQDETEEQPELFAQDEVVVNGKLTRLEQILEHGAIDLLITDEAHHAAAPSYQFVYAVLYTYNERMFHFGVTATPKRGDDIGLIEGFQECLFVRDIRWGIQNKYLCPIKVLSIKTTLDLSQVSISNGDYSLSGLERAIDDSEMFDFVIGTHREYAKRPDGTYRRGIAFTPTTDSAFKLAEKFCEAGFKAAAAKADTNKAERAQMLQDFREGKIDILCNVGLWTEGLDLPEIDAIHMCRPTKSVGLYTQMIGRGTRIVPGIKDDVLILDYRAKADREIVVSAKDVLGMTRAEIEALKAEAAREMILPGEVQNAYMFDGENFTTEGGALAILAREIDYLNFSPWRWSKSHSSRWIFLSLGQDNGASKTLAISPITGDSQSLYLIEEWKEENAWGGYPQYKSSVTTLATGEFGDLSDQASRYADKWGNSALARKAASWRSKEISEGQEKFICKLGGSERLDELKNSGDAADFITELKALKVLAKYGKLEKTKKASAKNGTRR